jgi:hypothetical protein
MARLTKPSPCWVAVLRPVLEEAAAQVAAADPVAGQAVPEEATVTATMAAVTAEAMVTDMGILATD